MSKKKKDEVETTAGAAPLGVRAGQASGIAAPSMMPGVNPAAFGMIPGAAAGTSMPAMPGMNPMPGMNQMLAIMQMMQTMSGMRIPVLIESTPGNGFHARSGEPLALTAEGPTREAVLSRLRTLIQDRFLAGAEIVSLDIPAAEHPLARFAGMLKDDPLLEEWKKAMEEYRRERDAEDDLP